MNIVIAPEQLGAESFRRRYRIRWAYLAGAMYRGIASKELVVAMGRAGLLGFLGTGGLSIDRIDADIRFIRARLDAGQAFGMNLLCNLDDPRVELDTVELYLGHGISCIEAAAFLGMTPALVWYRAAGLHRDGDGRIECRHRVIAKVSRPEVAEMFLSPPPPAIVRKLVEEGRITREQAELAAQTPMSHDLCVEADSAGHTDRGNPTVLLPAMQSVRRQMEARHRYTEPVHVGLAGGIGTPQAAAAAFVMGADFILTGSINQCTVEAGTSDAVKDMLERIHVQDTDYAPAGDMFETGARVQVLRKGVLFPARANKLFALHAQYDGWEDIPGKTRAQIETACFGGKSFAQIWEEVQAHHRRKGRQATLDKAAASRKHKMALVFRWYFAFSTRAALEGDEARQVDFQVHTGPALGAFNQWIRGTELESWRRRHVDRIAEKLMSETAALIDARLHALLHVNHATMGSER